MKVLSSFILSCQASYLHVDIFFSTDPCTLPKVVGNCRATIRKFYFDTNTRRCTQFLYGGCGGNANSFETQEECQQRCGGESVVADRASVKVDPASANVYPGNRLEMVCTLENAPTTQQVPLIWSKINSQSLPNGVVTSGGRLIINSINEQHAGEYECKTGEIRIPGTLDAYTSSATARISVVQGAILCVRSSVDKVVRGGNIEFTCALEGSDAPSKIEWSKVGDRVMPWGCFDNGQGMLVITGVDRHHEGVYQCHAKEAGLTSTVELRLTDSVPAIQYFIHVDKKTVSLTVGETAEIRCRVDPPADAPAPDSLIWSFEGSRTLPRGVTAAGNGLLSISANAGEDASGTYSCTPSSGSGEAKSSVVVRPGNASISLFFAENVNCFHHRENSQFK